MDRRVQPLDLSVVRAALDRAPVGGRVIYHERVASTMPIGHAAAADGSIPAGTVVVAEEQTSGRGRRQRHWSAPYATSLLVSVVLKAPLLPAHPAVLPMIAGVAIVYSLHATATEMAGQVKLKWPNDVLLLAQDGTAAKVAGVLIEAAYRQGALDHAVVGIGINVNQAADELPDVAPDAPRPTSLCLHLGRPVDRTHLLIELCRQLSARLHPASTRAAVFDEWRILLHSLGRRVRITASADAANALVGMAADVTLDGELVLIDDAGIRHVVSTGDVSLRSEL